MASRPTRKHVDLTRLTRSCISFKVRHENYEEALAGAERGMEAGAVEPGCHLTPYKCDQCSGWHVRNKQIVFIRKCG